MSQSQYSETSSTLTSSESESSETQTNKSFWSKGVNVLNKTYNTYFFQGLLVGLATGYYLRRRN